MTSSFAPQTFVALPLEAQLEVLEAQLGAGEAPEGLLELCAATRDHAPLVHLVGRLLERRWLGSPRARQWFAGFLSRQPDTAVHKVLKVLVGRGGDRAVVATLTAALDEVPLERLTSMCLIDRALRQSFPLEHDRTWQRVVSRCAEALRAGDLDEVTLDRLAQVPASAMDELAAAAERGAVSQRFARLRAELARQAVAVLALAPKAVSQSNAEELLSKRVYTEPGHFLVELLQNAEDAGARRWRLIFDASRVVVWHDGVPFDARDLVGVTSIGQTTKRRQQIGFFGVGFKSVYEVTERPQIYSGDYRFEIADVSVPKLLDARPPGLPESGTLLVLPLRPGLGSERQPAALFDKARALDPVVLFTLRHVREIDLELTAAAGGPRRHLLRERGDPDAGRCVIEQRPEGWQRAYLVQDDLYRWDRGHREAGRPEETAVMVGLRLDERGVPRPLEPGAPTIYGYLPTEEQTGLRFFVQGHFDLPVDRERISPDSLWNQWVLSKVPQQLARLARRALTSPPTEVDRLEVARALLEVLPLSSELSTALFRRITSSLAEALAGIALLPGLDGELHRPAETVWLSSSLARLFAGEPRVELGDGPRALLADDLDDRARDAAEALGAERLEVEGFIDRLEGWLAHLPDGALPTDPMAPALLRRPEVEGMVALGEALTGELDELSRRGGGEAAERLWRRLRRLPLVLDDQGGLRRAAPTSGAGPARGDPAIRQVFAGFFSFLHPALESTATDSFSDRLGLRRLTERDLLAALEDSLARLSPPLVGPEAAAFPGSAERLSLIHELLAEAPAALQKRASRLPLFPGDDGLLYPLALGPIDLLGVVGGGEGELGLRLRQLYGSRRPVLAESAGAAVVAIATRLGAPSLSIETLLIDLGRDPPLFDLDLAGARRLHAQLSEVRAELSSRTRKALAALPIWPDRWGRLHPLRGQGALSVAALDEVVDLFPEAPFLDHDVSGRAHLADMDVERLGLAAVIDALGPEAHPPLVIEPTPTVVEAVLRLLLDHGDLLRGRSRRRLAELPVFLSDTRRVCRLGELCRPDSAALRRLWGDDPRRQFLDRTSLTGEVVERLGLTDGLPAAGVDELISDLADSASHLHGRSPDDGVLPLVRDRGRLEEILTVLGAEAPRLSRSQLERLLDLPLFPDNAGRLCRLGTLQGGRWSVGTVIAADRSLRLLFDAAGVPLLDEEIERIAAPLLDAGGADRAGLEPLLEQLVGLAPIAPGARPAPLQRPELLEQVQATLVERRPELRRWRGREPLGQLAIWRTLGGAVVGAKSLVEPGPLLELCQPGTPERLALDRCRLDEAAAARLTQLGDLVELRPLSTLLRELVAALARAGEPLERQPAMLGDLRRVATVAELLFLADSEEPDFWPLVDGAGRLRLGGLKWADPDVLALLAGTERVEQLLSPGLVDALPSELLATLEPLTVAETVRALLRPARGAAEGFEPHPVLGDPDRRRALYRWLEAQELEIFSDAECRALLRASPFFPTSRGALVAPQALVLDPDLPDLGLDWTPGDEVSESTLDLLARHLGLARPRVEELLEVHLLPAYGAAVDRADAARAAQLLLYLANRLSERSALELRSTLRLADGRPLPVEVEGGGFHPPAELVLPRFEIDAMVERAFAERPELVPRPALERFSPDDRDLVVRFLRRLGVATEPPTASLAELMREAPEGDGARALAELCGFLRHRRGDLCEVLPLRSSPWVLDRTGCLRRPVELFHWSPELEALIGDFPELYLDERVAAALGESFGVEVGLKGAGEVGLGEVLRHLDARQRSATSVPSRVYQWLEEGLVEGRLEPSTLTAALERRRWICCDDGTFWSHERVLGVSALRYFGARRGSWELGMRRFPALCRLFGIPGEVGADEITRFLEEVGGEVGRRGDRAVMADEPALPRMILACAARLVELGEPFELDRDLPLILCTRLGSARRRDEERPRLVAAAEPSLVRSDTPTLEALFRQVGTLHLAARGSSEERAALEVFYDALGVRRLRDAYEVTTDGSGRDRSEEVAESLGALRSSLRALLAVLPRVRLQRSTLRDEGWVADQRLGRVVEQGGLRAMEGLEVTYRIDGVGEARQAAEAVYDPGRRELLVDVNVLERPEDHTTGLAAGLLSCLYDGPGEDQLADIVEILLPLRTRARMEAYLDRRHFPAVDSSGPWSPVERLADRLDELLDYGIDRRLAERFPELDGADLSRWRDPSLLEQALKEPPESLDAAARQAVRPLLAAVGLSSPSEELVDGLTLVLSAVSLSDVPARLWATSDADENEQGAGPIESLRLAARSAQAPAEAEPDREPPTMEALVDQLKREPPPPAVPRSTSGMVVESEELGDDALGQGELASGFWRRVARFFGLSEEAAPASWPRPPWARPEANNLTPQAVIQPQLWATPAARHEVASRQAPSRLVHAPAQLSLPYSYAISTLGATFDPADQSWSPEGAPAVELLTTGDATGATVAFQGVVAPGTCQLPVPLFGRLRSPPALVGAAASSGQMTLLGSDRAGAFRLRIEGSRPLPLRYVVELLRVPALMTASEGALGDEAALTRPTLELRALPVTARRWIDERQSESLDGWELALAAQAFVRRHYVYDDAYLEREEVRAALSRLRPGRGHHHLEVLHATAGGTALGRGICYELNVMVAELLRHLGVPSMIAMGWLLNEGRADRPDHLFALAVLPTYDGGRCLFPLEASTGLDGPLRPLPSQPARSTGGLVRPSDPPVLPAPGPWSVPTVNEPLGEADGDGREALRRREQQRLAVEAALLRRLVSLYCEVHRLSPPPELDEAPDGASPRALEGAVRRLRAVADELLGDPRLVGVALSLMRGELANGFDELPEAVRRLVRLGVARVRVVPRHLVSPSDETPPS